MSSPWYINDPNPPHEERLLYAHGTVMIISWMLLASTGILFARYGRLIRFGPRRNLFGNKIWFQIHRCVLCMVTATSLLGFFFILVQEKGAWVSINKDGRRIFAHSILGGIIVCCALLQAWMALFRCHSNSPFRPIFNLLHRSMGYLAFFLSIPTIFLVVVESKVIPVQQTGLIAILSLWSTWIIIVVIIFEMIEYYTRLKAKKGVYRVTQNEAINPNLSLVNKRHESDDTNIYSFNQVRLFLFALHMIVAISLTIPFIVIIWRQA